VGKTRIIAADNLAVDAAIVDMDSQVSIYIRSKNTQPCGVGARDGIHKLSKRLSRTVEKESEVVGSYEGKHFALVENQLTL
jgi:hypothetical protein